MTDPARPPDLARMKLTIVIPCYNELRTIDQIIEAVRRSPYPNKEIIVVDDCSIDGTREKLQSEIEPSGRVDRVSTMTETKARAPRCAPGSSMPAAISLLCRTPTSEYDPNEYPRLMEPIISGNADVVFGSRFVGGDAHRVLYFWHRVGNNMLTLLSNMLTDLDLTDMETCYKAFRREVIQGIEIEDPVLALSPRSLPKLRNAVTCGYTRWASPTMDAPMRKAKRLETIC